MLKSSFKFYSSKYGALARIVSIQSENLKLEQAKQKSKLILKLRVIQLI
jgi:hypothetical protein